MNLRQHAAPVQTASAPSVLFRVLRSAHELESRLEAALAGVGLSFAKMGVLEPLMKADGPLTLGELAERVRCVKSNLTQLVDRLEADGLVRRINDVEDRRVRRASLTPAGRKAHGEGVRIVALQEQEVANALSAAESAALSQALGRLPS